MTQEEQNLINTCLARKPTNKALLDLIVSRVSDETKEAIIGASKLADTALDLRRSFLMKAYKEAGIGWNPYAGFGVLEEIVGDKLAQLTT